MTVDLNCDLGEGAAHDDELMALVSSVNIACGGHAGDEGTMERALRLAQGHGVSAGAHPGYEDREGFGRVECALPAGRVFALVQGQVEGLRRMAAGMGIRLTHVKPHGALYNQASRDPLLAGEVAAAVVAVDPGLVLYGLAGGELVAAGRACGLAVAREVFADRRYRADGSLVPRGAVDAVIGEVEEACAQVLRLVRGGGVDTVCVHGDGPDAVVFARRVRAALMAEGMNIRAVVK